MSLPRADLAKGSFLSSSRHFSSAGAHDSQSPPSSPPVWDAAPDACQAESRIIHEQCRGQQGCGAVRHHVLARVSNLESVGMHVHASVRMASECDQKELAGMLRGKDTTFAAVGSASARRVAMMPPARSLFRFLASSNADNFPLALWLTSTPARDTHDTSVGAVHQWCA
jgi:hypothetical protein